MGEAMGEAAVGSIGPGNRAGAIVTLASVEEEARLIIFNPAVMIMGQAAYFSVAGLIYLFFKPVVPQDNMRIWLDLLGVLLAIIMLFNAVFFLSPADNRARMLLFRAVDKKQTILFDLVAVSVIWLLLPYGGEEHRIIIVAFCVGYVPLQMISDPENTFGNRFSVLSVLGSFAAFLLTQGGTAMAILAIMVGLYGAVLFYAADAFREVVVSALRNRRELQVVNAGLADALREVSASRDAKTRFIAAASHDLGQPISAAILFAEQAMAVTEPAAMKGAMAKCSKAVGSAAAMLGHMLHSMQLEADAVVPIITPTALGETLRNIATQFSAQAALNGITLHVGTCDAIIATDPVLLERAIGNLIDNAIVHSSGTQLRVSAIRAGDRMRVSVADDGVGIAASDMASIFDDYSQGVNTGSPTRGGFGLGLASVRRIAVLLGGDVDIDTSAGRGADFIIDIPARLLEVLAQPKPARPPGVSLSDQQTKVIRLVSRGLTNKEIARELSVAPSTVKTHLDAAFRLLGARNRHEAIQKAMHA